MREPQPHEVRTSLGRNLTHGMLDVLGRAIVTGVYEGRRFPTEADLAIQHGVSRSVTREAVKMLTAKGLLSARPRQGTIVQPAASWNLFDTDVLGWLLDASSRCRCCAISTSFGSVIEPMAARLAAAHADVDHKAAIRHGFDRMVAADAGDDDPLEADIVFHVAILRAAGNRSSRSFEDLVATALRSSIRFTNRFKGRSADLAEHQAVLVAIEASDADAADAAMRTIISDVLTLILQGDTRPVTLP